MKTKTLTTSGHKNAAGSARLSPGKEIEDVEIRFGNRLHALRLKANLSQLELTQILGINRSYYSQIERGEKICSLQILEVLSLGYRMSMSELLDGV